MANTPTRYRVDFDYLATLLLPSLLRKPKLRAWLSALLAPLKEQYAAFLAYQQVAFRELTYNGQVIIMEGMLNDQFDPILRRITIDNSDTELQPLYVNFYAEHESDPLVRFAGECPPWTYCYTSVEFNTQIGFIVRVPVALRTDQRTDQLNARIRRFKLACVHYQLLFV